MVFDKAYYGKIWGTVHRHDYCDGLANQLIATYGKCRILDIGTGCGELVRVLRKHGCDAWGLDVSEYAFRHSCAPEYVKLGDIRSIPYEAMFDVVHSQGVWGYFPESDIPVAWKECLRVGRAQHHNIDYDDAIPEHAYMLMRPKEWWDQKLRQKGNS